MKTSDEQSTIRKIRLRRAVFIFAGIASTAWFLFRVIPKPSRAAYPCMRTAAPVMSAFILWLIGLTVSAAFFKKSVNLFRRSKMSPAILLLLAGVLSVVITTSIRSAEISATPLQATVDDYPVNEPIGEAKGIFPGRVVWYWNPDATREASTMTVNNDGIINDSDDVFYLSKNNDEAVIDEMMNQVIMRLTGATNISSAWDSVFRYHNREVNQSGSGYTTGERIYIKTNNQGIGHSLNMNADLSQKDGKVWGSFPPHMTATSPYAIRAVVKQLVDQAGIPEDQIYVGDPHMNFNNIYYEILREGFPDIHIMGVNGDKVIDCEAYGRTKSVKGTEDVVFYSEKGELISGGKDKLYQQLLDADYIINIAAMKSHIRGGISLFCKSHFGSHTRDAASHLHPGLVSPDGSTENAGYGKYRVLTDIMGHEELGGKTAIFILDGLWGGPPHELHAPRKWDMEPFNGDWTSSIFASFDPVAIASVAHDFLRTEYSIDEWGDEAYPNILGVDDYLHQAADQQYWPQGITYDPENDGTPIGSLGTHEHWNNSNEMQYSRNIDRVNGEGIHLMKLHEMSPVGMSVARAEFTMNMFPNPAREIVFLEFENGYEGEVLVTVFDQAGRAMLREEFNKRTALFRAEIKLHSLQPGIYMVLLSTGSESMSRKLIVEGGNNQI